MNEWGEASAKSNRPSAVRNLGRRSKNPASVVLSPQRVSASLFLGMASPSANLWVLLGLGLAGVLLVTRSLRRVVKKDFGAFLERLELLPPPPPPPPKAPHPLSGLSFAAADLYSLFLSVSYRVCVHVRAYVRLLLCNGQTSIKETQLTNCFNFSAQIPIRDLLV